MLSSKDVLERTGISRATLNNYISCGLVPRPQVLPPGPDDGGAPRIGYFPDDTVERIETIQRLKREGWSLSRILGYFSGNADEPAAQAQASLPVPTAPVATAPPARASANLLRSLAPIETDYPAWFVDRSFQLEWANPASRSSAMACLSPVRPGLTVFASIDPAQSEVARFHLGIARQQAISATNLFEGLPETAVRDWQERYEAAAALPRLLVNHVTLPARAGAPARLLSAVAFEQGILFACTPHESAIEWSEPAAPASAVAQTTVPQFAPSAPRNTHIAVLAIGLHDAGGFWVRLGVQEYFALVQEVTQVLERVLRAHHGHTSRAGADRIVGHFLPRTGGNPLWDAIVAADEARTALRALTTQWRSRHAWDLELRVEAGLAEGDAWISAPGGNADLQVIGEPQLQAVQLSRSCGNGGVLVTRDFIAKLTPAERERVAHSVPADPAAPATPRLAFSFARLRDFAPVSRRFANLPVTEFVDLRRDPK